MLHAVYFDNGRAKAYTNHWIRTKRLLLEKAAGCNLFLRVLDLHFLRFSAVHIVPMHHALSLSAP